MTVIDAILANFKDMPARLSEMSAEYTPDSIDELPEGAVFVFGSNREGHHAGGAARTAVEKFGAIWGVGIGPQGRSYAIPTMGSEHEMAKEIAAFLSYARAHQDTRFYVTRIACGIAGHGPEYAAPYFAGHPANVIVPRDFAAIIEGASE